MNLTLQNLKEAYAPTNSVPSLHGLIVFFYYYLICTVQFVQLDIW